MAASYGLGLKRPSAIPGFGLALGFTLTYLSLIVLIPLAALVLKSATLGLVGFWDTVTGPRTLAALRLSFLTSLFAATVNAVFGTIIAWALVRYRFPGRRLLEAFVDLPFALPRTVQPVLEEFDRELEEASATLGANRRQTVFRVMLPTLMPAILTGFALALARAVGEYGSVIFIAGNMPFISEIAPLLIIIRLEEFSYSQAAAIGTAMLMISFGLLFFVHLIQAWRRRRLGND
jgi:sulfate/thiosulfate transport system permease protein